MTNQEIIKQLRAHGYRVRVQHMRYVSGWPLPQDRPYQATSIRALGLGRFIDPKGGVTHVDIIRPGAAEPEHEIHGQSRCQRMDNFVRIDGLRMALVDALAPFDKEIDRQKAIVTDLTFSEAGRYYACTVQSLDEVCDEPVEI